MSEKLKLLETELEMMRSEGAGNKELEASLDHEISLKKQLSE
jgi:hypothetical protein